MDSDVLMEWIYYHEVMSDFSLRHWVKSYERSEICKVGPWARSPLAECEEPFNQRSGIIACPIQVLDALSDASRIHLMDSHDPAFQQQMRRLEASYSALSATVERRRASFGAPPLAESSNLGCADIISELYELAALIYLDRAVMEYSGHEIRHRRLVSEGIDLLSSTLTCENPWPLFIIACEAAEDSQRITILEILDRTAEKAHDRRTNHAVWMRRIVEAIWIQMDLNEDGNMDYVEVLTAVISTSPFLPAFA